MKPSPMARVIDFRPRPTFSTTTSHVSPVHPSRPRIYDYEHEDEDAATTVLLAVSPLSASMIVRALATSSMGAAQELAVVLRDQLQSRKVIDVNPEGA